MSPKHLDRYAPGFAVKHNFRCMDALAQMCHVTPSFSPRRLTYAALTGATAHPSGARDPRHA